LSVSQLYCPPTAGFGYHLIQLSRRWRRLDEKVMASHGYTDVTWVPLLHLYNAPPMMQKDLAILCGLDTSSLVRLLDPLTKQGLLNRIPNPDDRRAWLLELTPEGHKQALQITEILYQSEQAILNDIPQEVIDGFLNAAKQIDTNLKELLKSN
jgi:MarR family transcriptional regulator for hemolysin